VASGGNVFAIPLNCYTDFVKLVGLVDGKDVRFSDSDTLFITLNKRGKNTPLNPGVALVRFQLLEILIRLGLKKYEESGITLMKQEAIQMMINNHLVPEYGEFTC
jgi:hypothetical protein